ncbi:hypothetical protein HAX54_043667 [Datura stramonium]|uniref:Uncharacterized protein n=1 Tax=Datura stramonium TaxID=4076 RepID=A0ABS8SNG9_DATST|nr:hypothetical protein [Datura stramonium]
MSNVVGLARPNKENRLPLDLWAPLNHAPIQTVGVVTCMCGTYVLGVIVVPCMMHKISTPTPGNMGQQYGSVTNRRVIECFQHFAGEKLMSRLLPGTLFDIGNLPAVHALQRHYESPTGFESLGALDRISDPSVVDNSQTHTSY